MCCIFPMNTTMCLALSAKDKEGFPTLPQDPNILLSYVNTKLRDEYDGLDALCGELDASPEELADKLSGLGYGYDAAANQFKPV